MKKVLSRSLAWLTAFILLLLTWSAGPARAQAPAWQWAASPGAGTCNATAVDAAGNVYVAGYFSGTATFGSTTLISTGGDDAFVAKLTSAGTYLWAVRAGGPGIDNASAITVAANGEVVVTGSFESPTADFGPNLLTGVGEQDLFVARLSTTGAWQWAVRAGGTGIEHGHGLAIDAAGDIYLCGDYTSPALNLGPTTLTNSAALGSFDVFVAKLTGGGGWIWAVGAGGSAPLDEVCFALALSSSGDVYVTGSFGSPTFTLGALTLTTSVGGIGTDTYVAKLSSAGAWVWARSAGGTEFDTSNGIAVDGSGNVYMAGTVGGPTATFGPFQLTSSGSADVFVAKLDATGTWQWAAGAGGNGSDGGLALAADSSGNTYLTGFFNGTATFGATMLANPAGPAEGVFVAKLSAAGAWQWAAQATGGGNVFGQNLAIDRNGNAYATGAYTDAPGAVFGSTTLPAAPGGSARRMFIARLGNNTLGVPTADSGVALSLYPNPAHETTWLTGAPGTTATLLDALGRQVCTVPLPTGTTSLDVGGLAPGVYVVRAGGVARRLVVE